MFRNLPFIFAAAASMLLQTVVSRADQVPTDIEIAVSGLSISPAISSGSQTGTLDLSLNDYTTVQATIDQTESSGVFGDGPAGAASVSGSIDVSNGSVTGGSITVGTTETGLPGDPSSDFTVTIVPGSGTIISIPAYGVNLLTASTTNGSFSAPSFAGIDLSGLSWRGGIAGSIVVDQSNVLLQLTDAAAAVPLPRALLGGGLLLSVLGLMQFRKKTLQKSP